METQKAHREKVQELKLSQFTSPSWVSSVNPHRKYWLPLPLRRLKLKRWKRLNFETGDPRLKRPSSRPRHLSPLPAASNTEFINWVTVFWNRFLISTRALFIFNIFSSTVLILRTAWRKAKGLGVVVTCPQGAVLPVQQDWLCSEG